MTVLVNASRRLLNQKAESTLIHKPCPGSVRPIWRATRFPNSGGSQVCPATPWARSCGRGLRGGSPAPRDSVALDANARRAEHPQFRCCHTAFALDSQNPGVYGSENGVVQEMCRRL